jgi:hypothetical protein
VGLFFLTIFELAVFGSTVFTNNPSIIVVNPFFFYIFTIFEISLIIWNLVLLSIGNNCIIRKKQISILFSSLLIFAVYISIILFFTIFQN